MHAASGAARGGWASQREDRPAVAWPSGETYASIRTIEALDLEDLKLLPWPMT